MNAVSVGDLTITGAATALLYSPEKLNTVNVGNMSNVGTIGFGGASNSTGNITNNTGGSLWLIGSCVAHGSALNETSSNLYLAGDLSVDGAVTNYGTIYIVGSMTASTEGAATRKLYTTGLWDPNGVFQLGWVAWLAASPVSGRSALRGFAIVAQTPVSSSGRSPPLANGAKTG